MKYIIVDQENPMMVCNNRTDAEEFYHLYAQEQMYSQYCWFTFNDIPRKKNPWLPKKFEIEYGADLIRMSYFVHIKEVPNY